MLTSPEIESKQLLVICVEPGLGSKLMLKNQNIIYKKDNKIINQCSLTRVLHLMIIGDISLTTNLIRAINDFGISVSLLKNNLSPYAYFGFETQANFLLRTKQYQLNEAQNLQFAKRVVYDKIHNQTVLLKRIKADEISLKLYIEKIKDASDAKELLGIEGSASKNYFGKYFELYSWSRRMPRVKEDPINFMLDTGYTVLFNFVDAICRHFGLDTYKGFYHTQFFARRSLVCDLMEPFRYLIDNKTRSVLGLRTIQASMFKKGKAGVYTDWQTSSLITQLYAEEIMNNRLEIFRFVQAFYRSIMKDELEISFRHRVRR